MGCKKKKKKSEPSNLVLETSKSMEFILFQMSTWKLSVKKV